MANITLNVQRLYVKNSSYEIMDAPRSFIEQGWPENSVEMRVNQNKLDEANHHEVTVTLTVTTKIGGKILCTTKAEQGGIFKIENVTEEQLDHILGIHCPHVLYPYACSAISQLAVMGSLPAIVLQPIDFGNLYKQRKEAEKAQDNSGRIVN